MRCNNCGWNNPEGATKCAKCNQILDEKNSGLDWASDLRNNSMSDDDTFVVCEKCGYQLVGDVSICPECGHQRDTKKTERIDRKHSARATVADISTILEPKANSKATQLDVRPSGKERNPRATVVEIQEDAPVSPAEPELTENVSEEKTYSYKLLAIDRPVIDTKSHGVSPLGVIEMKSSMEINLKLNDIVLIGGLRFARVE